MKSIYSAFILILLTVIIFTSITLVGSETNQNNLDARSTQVLAEINKTLVYQINVDNLTEEDLINGTNSQDKDSQGFEFLSAESDAQKKINILQTIRNSPSIVVASTGADVSAFKSFITIGSWFIGILLGLITFDAIFTRRVFNK